MNSIKIVIYALAGVAQYIEHPYTKSWRTIPGQGSKPGCGFYAVGGHAGGN